MDDVIINITDTPNQVTANITETPINVTINVIEGGAGMECSDLAACQTIIDIQADLNTVASDLTTHESNTSNPHNVTKSQVGLSNVDNTSDINKPVSTAQLAAIAVVQNDIDAHEANINNPHQTTLEQARTADNFFSGEVDMNANRLRNLPAPTNADEAVNKGYVDGLIDNTLKPAEGYNPTITSLFPTTYNALSIKKGDSFRISVAGVVNGINVDAEDLLIANINTPGQTVSNWQILESNREQASETVKGVAKITTQVVVEDELTSNNTDIVTPQKFWFGILKFISLAWTWDLKQTFMTAPRFNSVTASQRLEVNINKDLISVAKGTADNKNFGTTTNDIVEIGINLTNNAPIITNSIGKIITSNWVNYSVISTVIGWSSTSNRVIEYIDMGAYYIYKFYISGTSNSTATSFTIHVNEGFSAINEGIIRIANNAVYANGMFQLNSGSNIVNLYATAGGGSWNATPNSKVVSGTFIVLK